MVKKGVTIVLLVTFVLSLAACGGGGSAGSTQVAPAAPESGTNVDIVTSDQVETVEQGEEHYGGIAKQINIGDNAYPYGLPWNSLQNISIGVQRPVFDTLLIQYTRGAYLPALANDYTVSVENEEVVLNLRDDVYFTDGSHFDAEIVKWNFEKIAETGYMNVSIDGIEVRGDYQVAVKMKGGFTNGMVHTLISPSYSMTSKEYYDKVGETYAGENPVGSGPFMVKERTPGVKVEYERNPNYWQPGKPYLDGFEVHQITDVMTQNAAMLSTGPDRIDMISSGNGEQVSILSQSPDLELVFFESGVTTLYPSSINPDSPFAKQEVREAVSFALDRDLISTAFGYGYLKPATQLHLPGWLGHFDDERSYYSFDQAKAKELLAEAGYPDGFSTTLYVGNASQGDLAVALQSMLGDVGIIVELEFPESGRFTELRTVTGWEGLLLGSWLNISVMFSTYELHVDKDYRYYKSTWRPVDEYMPILDAAKATPVLQTEYFQTLGDMFATQMITIPIMNSATTFITNKRIKDAGFGYYGTSTTFRPDLMYIDE